MSGRDNWLNGEKCWDMQVWELWPGQELWPRVQYRENMSWMESSNPCFLYKAQDAPKEDAGLLLCGHALSRRRLWDRDGTILTIQLEGVWDCPQSLVLMIHVIKYIVHIAPDFDILYRMVNNSAMSWFAAEMMYMLNNTSNRM
jgi:hypothetical protein